MERYLVKWFSDTFEAGIFLIFIIFYRLKLNEIVDNIKLTDTTYLPIV